MTNQSRGNERDIRAAVGDVGPQTCHVSQTAALTAACLQHTATVYTSPMTNMQYLSNVYISGSICDTA